MSETSNTASELNSIGTTSYSYTFVTSTFTQENGNIYPTPQNPDWNLLLKWMNKIGSYSKPPSLDESINESLYENTYIISPFTNENGNYYPTPQNKDWNLLLDWMNQEGVYIKPPVPVLPEPEPEP